MKSQNRILLFMFFLSLSLLKISYSTLTFAYSTPLTEPSLQKYRWKNDDKSKNCTPDGICYRDPPKSPHIPHIITPSGGNETSAQQPIFRWQSVDNTEYYTLVVKGLDLYWEERIDGDRWRTEYTGPELQAGQTYHFIINANNRHPSSRERFKIVEEETLQKIKEDVAQLQTRISDPEEQAIAIAQLYQDNNLLLDAIETLEALMEKNSQTVAVYCQLAQLYRAIERDELATQIEAILGNHSSSCPSATISIK